MYEGKTRITYYDLDFKGNVKLSAILRMVHIAADIDAIQLGVGFSILHPLNITFVLQRFGLKISRMPVYDETVTIRTWPADLARGTFIRKGDMHDAKGNKLMEWASLWIVFDIAKRKILKPSALPVKFEPTTDIEVDILPTKIILPENVGTPFSEHIHTVRYADVDTNMHMNNSIYGDLLGNAVFSSLDDCTPWKEVQINYLGETRYGEEIKIAAYKSDGTYLVKGEAPGRTSFLASVVI